MKRMSVTAAAVLVGGLGCVSDNSLEPVSVPEVYRVPRRSVAPPRPLPPAVETRRTVPHFADSDAAWFPPGRIAAQRWRTIVIHHSATARGSATQFDKNHREQNGWDELGYHFVIGNGAGSPDGLVEVGSRWTKQKHGAHCKTAGNYYNEHGIGICLVGDFSRSRPTPRQMASLDRLVRFLCSVTRIPPSAVTTHGEVTRRTECPGRNFPVLAFRRSLVTPVAASSLP